MPAAQAVFIIRAYYQIARRGLAQKRNQFFNLFGCTEIKSETAYAGFGQSDCFFNVAFAEPKSGVYQTVCIHCFITHPKTAARFAPVAAGQEPGFPFKASQAKYPKAAASFAKG